MHQNQTTTSRRTAVALGLPERLALYVFAVATLISFLLESPVPMAIAP